MCGPARSRFPSSAKASIGEAMMEAEERPRKFRKLDTNGSAPAHEEAANASLLSMVTEAVDETVDASSLSNSKPQEPAANLPETAEIQNDGFEGHSGHEAKPQRRRDPDPAEHERRLLHQQESTQPSEQLSKNQLKKLHKREEWEAGRDYRKSKRKQKNQEKKVRKREAREEEVEQLRILQNLPPATEAQHGPTKPSSSRPKSRRPIQMPITILIDCGFDNLMMEKERISLGSQITRAYSDNHRAPYQTHLVISSWGGLLRERFNTVLNKHYLNWKGVSFDEADFVEVAKKMDVIMKNTNLDSKIVEYFEKFGGVARDPPGNPEHEKGEELVPEITESDAPIETPTLLDPDSEMSVKVELNGQASPSENPESAQKDNALPATESIPATSSQSMPVSTPQGETIYLTSDSPNTLSTLSPYSTYIIGGLVDKNRHKGICYKTARTRDIKTAKLPIGEYLEMSSRKVLATNHVVEILLRWLEEASGPEGEEGAWGRAFLRVIPKRKGGKLRGQEEEGDEDDGVAAEEDPLSDADKKIDTEQTAAQHRPQPPDAPNLHGNVR